MVQYTDRIPFEQSYAQALGEAVYNFATAGWMIVYLGSLIDTNFLSRAGVLDFEKIAQDFTLLSEVGKYPEFVEIAKRFSLAVARRQDLEQSVPITAYGGVQELDGSEDSKDYQWTEDNVVSFAKDLETLDIDANALYYKLKGA